MSASLYLACDKCKVKINYGQKNSKGINPYDENELLSFIQEHEGEYCRLISYNTNSEEILEIDRSSYKEIINKNLIEIIDFV